MKKIRFGLIGSDGAQSSILDCKNASGTIRVDRSADSRQRKGKYIFQKTQCSCSIITGRIGIRETRLYRACN